MGAGEHAAMMNKGMKFFLNRQISQAWKKWREEYAAHLEMLRLLGPLGWGEQVVVAIRMGDVAGLQNGFDAVLTKSPHLIQACVHRAGTVPKDVSNKLADCRRVYTEPTCSTPPRDMHHNGLIGEIHQHTLGPSASPLSNIGRDLVKISNFGRWTWPSSGGLNARCPLNLLPVMGDSTLHLAVRCGQKEIIKMLLQMGVSADIENEEGRTAVDLCPEELAHLFLAPNDDTTLSPTCKTMHGRTPPIRANTNHKFHRAPPPAVGSPKR